jgi:mRNA interferase RelE/StbE
MTQYKLTFARSARKELEALGSALLDRMFPKIEVLAQNPRPRNCRKLRGEKNLWRIRIGEYRVIYAIYDRELQVDVIGVRHRSKAYE